MTTSAARLPAVRPSLEEVEAAAADADLVPVVAELLGDCDTPVSLLLRLGGGSGSFLLESVEGGERLARYSFIGTEPVATLRCAAGELERTDASGSTRLPSTDPLADVEREVQRLRVAAAPWLDVPLLGGAVGFLAYEAAHHFERLPRAAQDPLRLPDAWFGVYDTLVVVDHVTHRLLLVTHARCHEAPVAQAYDAARARLAALRERLRRPLPEPVPLPPGARSLDVVATTSQRGRPDAAATAVSLSRDDFCAAVRSARELILAGDIFQVQVSRRFALPLQATAFDVYRALRSLNPSPYMFFLDTPDGALVGASPEMLVRVTGRRVDYHPIAGTRRRGATPERDAELEAELRASEKERAEHLMLVDLGRNDLGRVCRTGSVQVDELMGVERFSHVMHLVSSLSGELAPGRSAVDALRAAYPAGTVTGAPKVRAMEVIAELEPEARGVYAGAAGYLGFGGDLDTAICLRTLLVRDGVAYAQAAGGVVADSTEEEEALEIDNKLGALLAAVERANAGLDA